MRGTTEALAAITLIISACAPPVASVRSTSPVAALPTPGPSAAAVPAASPSAVSAPEVKIVEPPFRPPQEWAYAPVSLSVKVGTTVTWTNTGSAAHTVTADDGKSFDSGTIDPKATFTLTPTTAGTFAYHCTFHAWMMATLSVTS